MVSVKEFGAKGDSRQNDYPAFEKAFASGSNELYVPAGKYRIHGMLTLPSDFTLKLHPEAYMILDDYTGSEGCPYLLTAVTGANNVTVDGGVWEGNCRKNPRIVGEHPHRGILISFSDVSHLTLKNMTVRNSEAFHIRLNYVTDFLVEHITFDDRDLRFTQDGVHVGGGCERGVIRHIRGVGPSSPNDDMIALISDFSGLNMAPSDPIWGQKPGPIRDIEISHVHADNTFSFLRISSVDQPIENVKAHHISGGCYYVGLQMEINPYVRDQYQQYPPETVYGTGVIRNVEIADWDIYTRLYYGNRRRNYFRNYVGGMIDIEQSVENLTIRNFHRDMERDAKGESLPTLNLKNFRQNKVTVQKAAQIITPGYTPFQLQGSIDDLQLSTVNPHKEKTL